LGVCLKNCAPKKERGEKKQKIKIKLSSNGRTEKKERSLAQCATYLSSVARKERGGGGRSTCSFSESAWGKGRKEREGKKRVIIHS